MKTLIKLSVGLVIIAICTRLDAEVGTIVGATAQFSTANLRRDDIGQAIYSGEASGAQQRLSVRSYGAGFGGKRDSFEYVHQTWAGDGAFVARVATVEGPRYSAVAGLMVRAGLEDDAGFFMVGLTAEGKAVMKSRCKRGDEVQSLYFSAVPLERELGHPLVQTGQNSLESAILPGAVWLGTNFWLKVERRGDVFAAFSSEDGNIWYWLGSEKIPMTEAHVGVAVAGLEFFNAASAQFEGMKLNALDGELPAQPRMGTGDGLLGTYNGKSTGGQMQRVDPVIDFRWGEGGPDPKIGGSLFQVRWEGMLEAQYSETYAISVLSDDGARLWIDDRLVVDQWFVDYWYQQPGHPPQETTAELTLAAGKKYTLRLEYFQKYGEATAQLYWSSASTPKQIVPQSQLYSHSDQEILANRNGDGIPDRWARAYGLDPSNASAAREDSNGDGIPNYKKYLAGMDPNRKQAFKKPAGAWQSRDIGSVGIAGSNSVAGNQIVAAGSGDDIFERKDGFQFVYQPWRGDVQIVARIDPLSEHIHDWAKAGIMIREDLTDRSKNAFVALTAGNGITIQNRTEFSGSTSYNYWWWRKDYHWVKLVRRGNAFEMYTSLDGTSWEWLSTQNISMEADAYVGLGVSSRDNTTLYSARFSNIRISAPEPQKNPNAATALGDGLKGTYRNLADSTTVERIDPNIAFDWELGAPAPGIDPDHFVATWEGKLEAPYNETYCLRLGINDRARLWLDGELVMDWNGSAWDGDGPNEHSFYGEWLPAVLNKRMALKAGHQYDFKLECYNDNEGRSLAMLYWSSPSIAAQPIPQQYFYSPTNKYYGHLPDRDADGMPDAWERAYGLNPNNPADAKQDPDGDGLTNLQEYQAGSNPWKKDSNDDGIPDNWAVKYGLSPGGESIANEDTDHDGLTNLQEYRLGTNPTKEDTDGDGLPDLVEVTETGTDPSHADTLSLKVEAVAPGNAVVGRLGDWAEEKGSIYALSRRGYVEYELQAPRADVFRLEVWGGAHRSSAGRVFEFPLILSVDGEYLDRKTLIDGGNAHTLTPWLAPGPHRVQVFWDNALTVCPALQITSVKLVSLKGKDVNGNGVSDWVEAWLKTLSGLDPGATNVIESPVSPYTLEGHERYLSTMKLSSGGRDLTVQAGANPRWYADVPLTLRNTTLVDASFENGGLLQSAKIDWVPLDMTRTNQVAIRKGDSLLLSIGGNRKAANDFTAINLTVAGMTNCSGTQPIPLLFEKAGNFTVIGRRTDATSNKSYTLQVTVVDRAFSGDAPAWVGNYRDWKMTNDVEAAVLESAQSLSLDKTNGLRPANGMFRLKINDAAAGHVVARLGQKGPILAGAAAKGFRLFSGSATGVRVIQEYEDGSQLVEMGLVMSPVRTEVRVNVRLIVGGVMFEDGTIEKSLTAGDFNKLGEASVRFVRPMSARTSVCHHVQAFDGTIPLGSGD